MRQMRRLRYADLLALGIVRNRVTLSNWIRKQNFPKGALTGPNSRTWGESEIQDWLESRPAGPKPNMPTIPKDCPGRGRPRKSTQQREA
jgi:predicted DNA-binding transcriptional regulator AlpA